MKFSFFILLGFLVSVSCSRDENLLVEDFQAHTYPQTWKLYKMTGNMVDSETTGDDMAWQEEYQFKSDGTVLKTRNVNNETISITGRYELYQENEQQGIVITYDENSSIIGSCTGNKEHLLFDHEEKVLYSNWWACDGPGLFYKR